MKPSLMWPSARPNSAVNIQAVCPRLGVQDAMARPWSTSIKSHSPPAGRYVHTSHITRGGKTYTRHLRRESYRAHGKVLHRTIANVSHCSEAEIKALRL